MYSMKNQFQNHMSKFHMIKEELFDKLVAFIEISDNMPTYETDLTEEEAADLCNNTLIMYVIALIDDLERLEDYTGINQYLIAFYLIDTVFTEFVEDRLTDPDEISMYTGYNCYLYKRLYKMFDAYYDNRTAMHKNYVLERLQHIKHYYDEAYDPDNLEDAEWFVDIIDTPLVNLYCKLKTVLD